MLQLFFICERNNYKQIAYISQWNDYFKGIPEEFINKKPTEGFNKVKNFHVHSSTFSDIERPIELEDKSNPCEMRLLVEVTTFSDCYNSYHNGEGGSICFKKGKEVVLAKVCSSNSKCTGTGNHRKGDFCFIELTNNKDEVGKNEIHYLSVNQDKSKEHSGTLDNVRIANGKCLHEHLNITGSSCAETGALFSYSSQNLPYVLTYSSVAKNIGDLNIIKLTGVKAKTYTITKCNIISNKIKGDLTIIATFTDRSTIKDSCFINNTGTLIGGNPIPKFINCSVNMGDGYNTLFLNPLLGYTDQAGNCIASYDAVGTITVLLENTDPIKIDEKKVPTSKDTRRNQRVFFCAILVTVVHSKKI